ncbi:hypothetical protein POJ06DRAFT_269728 [Lipomyces tetrasporus]|uniref:Uncharacterized protein n=1 Tax=Lipomyces tetrasporus TaxID=54092 RepID=A0AAD7VQY6_9ASCO|nr:uncharacterized protein POJ06DRAFT_269728 [Lipomyces tetrasporus]KAJ8098633.1 hypothetical protein POJ06DRAFT_269728 [Lipomyces tetrasporus]
MESYWYWRREHWAPCHRSAHGLIETINYIESWHSVLKGPYIGSSRLKRLDYSISLACSKVEVDYPISKANLGSINIGITAETQSLKLAKDPSIDDIDDLIMQMDDGTLRGGSSRIQTSFT